SFVATLLIARYGLFIPAPSSYTHLRWNQSRPARLYLTMVTRPALPFIRIKAPLLLRCVVFLWLRLCGAGVSQNVKNFMQTSDGFNEWQV
ncbi:MAG: hypothetical protein ACR2LC_06855, partial [Pyrinomonadaceae bacterium]